MRRIVPLLFFFMVSAAHAAGSRYIIYSASSTLNCTGYANGGTLTTIGADSFCADDVSGSAGASTLAVKIGGVSVSSPTAVINFSSNTFKATQSPTGTSNITSMVDTTTAVVNYAYLFNGTNAVWAPQGTSFSFSIASFSDSLSSTIQIGTGTWKAVGGITFTASYNNGPATSGYVSNGTSLTMTSTFQGPTVSTASVSFPGSPGGNVTFTLNAAGAAGSATSSIVHTFNNLRYWGIASKNSGFTSGDVTGLATNDLTNALANAFTVSPGAGQYIVYAYPKRFGTATFTIGGFNGGMNPPETVTIVNSSGYSEDYYVYGSVNSNLGTSAVTAS